MSKAHLAFHLTHQKSNNDLPPKGSVDDTLLPTREIQTEAPLSKKKLTIKPKTSRVGADSGYTLVSQTITPDNIDDVLSTQTEDGNSFSLKDMLKNMSPEKAQNFCDELNKVFEDAIQKKMSALANKMDIDPSKLVAVDKDGYKGFTIPFQGEDPEKIANGLVEKMDESKQIDFDDDKIVHDIIQETGRLNLETPCDILDQEHKEEKRLTFEDSHHLHGPQ